MTHRFRIAVLFSFTIFLMSCKEEVKKATPSSPNVIIEKPEEKAPLTEAQKEQVNSVMSKLMLTSEAKTFTSALVSANMTELLSKNKGPYTVLAPSVAAFQNLDTDGQSILTTPTRKEEMVSLLRTHIVEGKLDTVALVKNIRSGNGSYAIKTLSGATLTASKKGMDIIIKDANGAEAVIGKSDILGSNGVVHILNTVMGLGTQSTADQ